MANATHYTDGHGFRIELVNQGIVFYEKSVQIPGSEGGDPINITTNDNTAKHSFAPPALTEDTQAQAVVTYDSTDELAAKAAVDQSDDIQVTYPDGSTAATFSGWLRSFIPDNAEGGAQPTATIIVQPQGEAPA
jgi:hypothetical protein